MKLIVTVMDAMDATDAMGAMTMDAMDAVDATDAVGTVRTNGVRCPYSSFASMPIACGGPVVPTSVATVTTMAMFTTDWETVGPSGVQLSHALTHTSSADGWSGTGLHHWVRRNAKRNVGAP